jgi:voltage-gated potassium channel
MLLIITHVFAMMEFEGLELWPAIWLTMTTITTVGYGDTSAATQSGQISTIVLLYVSGISLLTLIVSDLIDFRIARRERMRAGNWNWDMEKHIVIINAPKHNRVSYFERLIGQIRETDQFKKMPIQLLNTDFPDGLPESLQALNAVHTTGQGSDPRSLKYVNIELAEHIIVLSKDEYDTQSDSTTFDICHRMSDLHIGHKVIAESVLDENRQRINNLGIKTCLRPIRSYPELMVRAMDAPGSEVLIEDMFTRANDHTQRYTVWLEGEPWADIVSALIQSDHGTAMAYIKKDGEVICHPPGDENVVAQSLLILVKTESIPTQHEIQTTLEQYFHKKIAERITVIK